MFFSYSVVALAAYAAGDYAEAAEWGHRAAALNPRYTANLRFLAAGLAANGQIEEAQQVGPRVEIAMTASFRHPSATATADDQGLSSTPTRWAPVGDTLPVRPANVGKLSRWFSIGGCAPFTTGIDHV